MCRRRSGERKLLGDEAEKYRQGRRGYQENSVGDATPGSKRDFSLRSE